LELPKIKPVKKSGNEPFYHHEKPLDFNLKDFWSWNQSNLLDNTMRGVLAEFIVKEALGIKEGVRTEWECYDLKTESGIKVEVKSAAYIQSWKQKGYSKIQFGIGKTISDTTNPAFDGISRRWSDYYIFCVLDHKDQNTVDPLNLDQWIFYVLKTEVLNSKVPDQNKINLSSLLKLNPVKTNYYKLKNQIN
jgi:hypothetical protein